MPRTARASAANWVYHVLNRGNGRADVFHDDQDYAAFIDLMHKANERLPLRVLGWCLLPNHFHLVLWPRGDGDLSRWMQWLMTSHVRRYHRHYESNGHVWQGRFKAFPIQQDEHLLTVLRYVERNPLRAKLTRKAEAWPWSSLHLRLPDAEASLLSAGPVALGSDWVKHVNEPQTEAEVLAIHNSIARGAPLGSAPWQRRAANRLGLEASLNPRGRPKGGKK